MRTAANVTAVATALALAGLLTACDKSPTAPDRPPSGPPGTPSISRVEIVGPRAIAPGETAQFSAIAHLPDRSSREVTNEARWGSDDNRVLSIAGPGLATGRERGDTKIFTDIAGYGRTWKDVIVVPAGTYRLAGSVSEGGLPPGPVVPVVGARVEVTSGVGAGLLTTTDLNGLYRLYVAAGETNIRVIKDGYQSQTRTITVADHQELHIGLLLSSPREDRSGTYTLTIAAANDCLVKLPEEARIRRYTAVVTQRGPELVVALTGATFGVWGDDFSGTVEPGRAVFSLGYYDLDGHLFDAGLVEKLATTTFLAVVGTVVATGPADRLAGTLDGEFLVFERDPGLDGFMPAPIAACYSASHQFVLSR